MNRTKLHLRSRSLLLAGCLFCLGGLSQAAAQAPDVVTGDNFTLVLDAGNNLYSFGANDSGQLGVADAGANSNSVLVIQPAGVWEKVAASRAGEDGAHVLAIRTDGTLWAWGSNSRGQLGIGSMVDSPIPVQVGVQSNWVEIACGSNYSYAINTNGELYGWGDNSRAQLMQFPNPSNAITGIGSQEDGVNMAASPMRLLVDESDLVVTADDSYTSIAAGTYNALAIRADGALVSWGFSGTKQLALGFNQRTPAWIPHRIGTGVNWVEVFSGADMCFALESGSSGGTPFNGKLFAWGAGSGSQDGFPGGVRSADTPRQVGSATDWADIAVGEDHALGLKEDGSLFGWGLNLQYQLGQLIPDGSGGSISANTRYHEPQLLATGTFAAIGAGNFYSAVLDNQGRLIAFGINDEGQLGSQITFGVGDIEITSVIVTTADLTLGDPLNATVTVRNAGTGIITDDIEFAAVLSPTTNFDDGIYPLTITSGSPITDDLGPGASVATPLVMTLPASVDTGTYFLVVRADPDDLILEATSGVNDGFDATDGDDADDDPDGLLFQADLQIVSTDIVVTPTIGAFPLQTGDSIDIEVTITNEDIGTVPADSDGSFALRYVLSQAASLAGATVVDLLVDNPLTPDVDESRVLITEEVPAGGSIVKTMSFILPDSLGVGDFYAGLVVDVNSDIEESDEDNNTAFTATALVEVEGLQLGEALDNLTLDFIPQGDGIWYGSDASVFASGGVHEAIDEDAAVSPPISGGQSAYISTTLAETSLITFRWKANTSSPDNRLIFRYLGAEVGSGDNEISGISGDWVDVSRIAPAGVQVIWQYIEGTDAPNDEVYLDNVQISGSLDDPDFILDDVELVEDSDGNSGTYVLGRDKLDLSLFVRNQASDYIAAFDGLADVRVYLSSDGTFNPADDRLIYTFSYTAADGILEGNTSLIQPSITLPTDLAGGNYRLIVVVDEDDNVTEVLEDNNIFISETANVELVALPDFTVTNVSPNPGFFLVGDQLDFQLTLENNGLEAEFDPITVRIVFSTDNVFDDGDYVFGDFQYNGGLAADGQPGSSNTYSPDFAQIRDNISPIADFLFFGVVIDPDNVHPELDENDNAVFFNLPDFIFGQVSLDEAMEFDELGISANNKELPSFFGNDNLLNKPFVGQTSESSSGASGDAAQSSDIGDSEAATFSVNFQSDTDTIISFDWRTSSEFEVVDDGIKADWLIVYVDDQEVGRIAGEREWEKFTRRVSAGAHNVRWEYRKDGSVSLGADTAWVDNFQYRLPDLEVSNIVLNAQSVNPGDTINFSFTVSNVGEDPVPATPNYSVDARFSPDNQWGGNGDVELVITPDPVNNGELAAGDSVVYNGSVVVPAGFSEEGDYFFGLRVDPDVDSADDALNGDGLVLETDEANNTVFTNTALITVIPPVTLNEALDLDPGVLLTGGGAGAWFGLDGLTETDLPPGTVIDSDSDDVARSGAVSLGETSFFETQITGPQVLKFRWKVDSASSNTLEVAVNGIITEGISGRVDWDFGFGPFTITYDGDTTTPLRSEAPASEVAAALNLLPSISSAGGVTVTGPTLIPLLDRFFYEIEFVSDGDQQGQMIFNALDENRIASSSLTTSQNGSPGVQEARRLSIEPNISFTLSYEGETTTPIPYYATAADVAAELNALGSITTDGGVTVADHPLAESALDFLVTFNVVGERELITVNASGLRQPVTIEAELNSDRFKYDPVGSGGEGVEGSSTVAQIQPLRIGPEITVFVPAGAGAQTVRWTYRKNSDASGFEDAGCIDQLRILDFAGPELVLTQLNYVPGTYVLDVTAISGAPDQKLGTEVLDITVQAQNQGTDLPLGVGAFTTADLEVRLSTDQIYGNVDDIVLGSFSQVEGALDSGDILAFLGGLPLGDNIPEDDYYLIVKIDANERVDEFSKANNIVISENRDVRVERKPRLLIYDALNTPNVASSSSAFYVDVVEYDEARLYYPEAPMRLEMEIQNIGLDDLFDQNGQVLSWRVNYRLGVIERDSLISLPTPLATDDFDGTVTGFIDLGSTTIAEAMEGRRLAAPSGDRVALDVEFTLPTLGRLSQLFADGDGVRDYIYFIQIVVDADDTIDESGVVNVWNNVDLSDLANTTVLTDDVDDGLFSIFNIGEGPTTSGTWEGFYGVTANAAGTPAEVANFLAYAFNRNPANGDTVGNQFPGTYGVDTLGLEEFMTVTFDIVTTSTDLSYVVEASGDMTFASIISSLTIEPPYTQLVGADSLTGEGGLIDQEGVAELGQDPEDVIQVISVVDEGYSARVTLRYPTPLVDAATGFIRVSVNDADSNVPNPTD